ncbi:hypothetical protein FisN_21Lh083 [Fistulifera solaris]|uniref:DUF6824 domain-containing protein n=1 Tax=Fistulifera solaris TaxID=1519565 RepID=A0A1Z5KKL2_FISSO|nr:hypothetical protein FisN_21Lh083 [Fistulifera solaris]|eukprot:GAX26612.1 hypothetical protein FisN_21Lh083 [Fistulifera solaris]
MLSFQENQIAIFQLLLSDMSKTTTLTLQEEVEKAHIMSYEYDEEPIPLNRSDLSLSLEPQSSWTESPACGSHLFESRHHQRGESVTFGAFDDNYRGVMRVDELFPSCRKSLATESTCCGPNDHDIVCSRGKVFYKLPGNIRFREAIRSFMPEYMKATSKMDKSLIIDNILDIAVTVDTIGRPSRFLKYHSRTNSWSIMGHDQVRDKVGHALREAVYDMERERKLKAAKKARKLTQW